MVSDSMEEMKDYGDYVPSDISNELIESARKGRDVLEANKIPIGPASRLSSVKIRSLKVSQAKNNDTKAMLKLLKKSFVLNEQSNRPNQNYRCQVCARDFSKFTNALDHVRTHYGYKPFDCKTCGHSFI